MKTLAITSLMLLAAATMQAKTVKNNSKTIFDGARYMMACPQPSVDSQTGKSTVKWNSTEDRHVKGRDDILVENVPIGTLSDNEFFKADNYPADVSLVSFWLELEEENNETVMHCYMKMPADTVTNFWLASDETGIVDYETGTHYRAQRCEPADAWYKYFSFTAPKDSIVDFKVYFPRLRPNVRTISIYGLPNWYMRGGTAFTLSNKQNKKTALPQKYDKKPKFHTPTLVRPAKDYSKNNSGSWSVYKDAHLIKPTEEGTLAMWRTPEATYIAVAHEQNWLREYMGVEKGGMLIDNQGRQYQLQALQDYPLGEIYWVEGYSGDFIATLKIFEPLPLDVETITYYEPDGEPFSAWGANWKGTIEKGLDVQTLRENQKLFEYKKRDIIIQ